MVDGTNVAIEETDRQSEGLFGWIDGSLVMVALGSTVLVISSLLVQVSFGAYSMSIAEAWQAVFNPNVIFNPSVWDVIFYGGELPEWMGTKTLVVWTIRLPRVLVGVLVGMNLAVSGAIFQAVTRNELASPYILGVSSGAGLAILLTLIIFSGFASYLPLFAAIGGATAFLLVYAIAWKGGTNPVRLILAGVIVATVFQSLQSGLFFFADNLAVVQSAISWTVGSLTGTNWEQVRIALPLTIIVIPVALLGSRQLNVLLLGERTAMSLGMSVERVRFALSSIAILAASTAIAVAGIVGFVGLIVPHVVRNIVGSDYKRLMVGCVFAGPALVTVADVGARLALGTQIPVGVVTGLLGGPYFLYLMRKQQDIGKL
jgi:iron complex transport system permease protein